MAWLYRICIIVLSSFLCCAAWADELPDLGSRSEAALPPYQEKEMGAEFMRAVYRTQSVIPDPLVTNYIDKLGNRLVAHSHTNIKPFHFFIMRNSRINAFAGPGGYVGINSGLFLATNTESQLAGVLAHEISHVTQHHLIRKLQAAKNLNLAALGTMVAAVLIGTQTGSDVAVGAMHAGLGSLRAQGLTYSRQFEQESDRIGMQVLYKSGYDPHGMSQFFARMQQLSFNQTSTLPEWASTHPLTESRVADTENRAQRYNAHQYSSSKDYFLMRERVRVFSIPTLQALTYYQAVLGNQDIPQEAERYGYSLALLKNRQFDAAQQQITALMQQNPNEIIYQMAAADIALGKNDDTSAMQILQKALAQQPKFYPLIVDYADALIHSGKYSEAIVWLKKQLKVYPQDISLMELYAIAAGKTGDLVNAYQARAAVYLSLGEPGLSGIQLEQALKLPELTKHDRAIILARLNALKPTPTNGVNAPPSSFSP